MTEVSTNPNTTLYVYSIVLREFADDCFSHMFTPHVVSQMDRAAFDVLPAELQSEVVNNFRKPHHHHHYTAQSPVRKDAVSFWKGLNLGGSAHAHPRGDTRASPGRKARGRAQHKHRQVPSPRRRTLGQPNLHRSKGDVLEVKAGFDVFVNVEIVSC